MLELSQIVALAIFIVMFIAIIIGKVHRVVPALIGAALTITVVFLIILKSPQVVSSVLNLGQLGQFRFWIPGEEHMESYGIKAVSFTDLLLVQYDNRMLLIFRSLNP